MYYIIEEKHEMKIIIKALCCLRAACGIAIAVNEKLDPKDVLVVVDFIMNRLTNYEKDGIDLYV